MLGSGLLSLFSLTERAHPAPSQSAFRIFSRNSNSLLENVDPYHRNAADDPGKYFVSMTPVYTGAGGPQTDALVVNSDDGLIKVPDDPPILVCKNSMTQDYPAPGYLAGGHGVQRQPEPMLGPKKRTIFAFVLGVMIVAGIVGGVVGGVEAEKEKNVSKVDSHDAESLVLTPSPSPRPSGFWTGACPAGDEIPTCDASYCRGTNSVRLDKHGSCTEGDFKDCPCKTICLEPAQSWTCDYNGCNGTNGLAGSLGVCEGGDYKGCFCRSICPLATLRCKENECDGVNARCTAGRYRGCGCNHVA